MRGLICLLGWDAKGIFRCKVVVYGYGKVHVYTPLDNGHVQVGILPVVVSCEIVETFRVILQGFFGSLAFESRRL